VCSYLMCVFRARKAHGAPQFAALAGVVRSLGHSVGLRPVASSGSVVREW
jgi:hypothetical protein